MKKKSVVRHEGDKRRYSHSHIMHMYICGMIFFNVPDEKVIFLAGALPDCGGGQHSTGFDCKDLSLLNMEYTSHMVTAQ